ncbi:MAG: DEAD/DEAH box helicase [Actinomycetota bacterium]|nr:DEAD/DEAH box helicase [Actinomycetota bacterium]
MAETAVTAPPAPPDHATLDPSWGQLLARLAEERPVDRHASALVDGALEIWARPGFEKLASLPWLRFQPFPHQLAAATRALRSMSGRAILADEVGLGKTIEAGLVATELRVRGLANRVLVLAPAGLVEQWREELERKFALSTVVPHRGSWPEGSNTVVVASLAAARRPPLRDALVAEPWDLVVVDEAHRVKNPRSASGRLARSVRARYLLLLTATPVENRLGDLFELVNLVRPGHLGTPAQFRARHGATGATDPTHDLAGLRERLAHVMVRHRRSEVALMLPRRLAATRVVPPLPEEADLYRLVSERVRAEGRGAPASRALALRVAQRLAGSSPWAPAATLRKLGWDDLADRCAAVDRTAKAEALLDTLSRHLAVGDKVIVFTAFRETLDGLRRALAAAGLPTAVYHGSLSRREKEAAIEAFRGDTPVLLTTEAAGEGRNLQFCHVMVNYDLPWNPMQLEQRLGRVHRIGQDHDVTLTNLVGRDTIEERILRVLEAKLNLFELVVGELDMILGRIEEDFDFESSVFQAHLASRDDEELDTRLGALGDELAAARTEHHAGRARVDQLIEDGRR